MTRIVTVGLLALVVAIPAFGRNKKDEWQTGTIAYVVSNAPTVWEQMSPELKATAHYIDGHICTSDADGIPHCNNAAAYNMKTAPDYYLITMADGTRLQCAAPVCPASLNWMVFVQSFDTASGDDHTSEHTMQFRYKLGRYDKVFGKQYITIRLLCSDTKRGEETNVWYLPDNRAVADLARWTGQ